MVATLKSVAPVALEKQYQQRLETWQPPRVALSRRHRRRPHVGPGA